METRYTANVFQRSLRGDYRKIGGGGWISWRKSKICARITGLARKISGLVRVHAAGFKGNWTLVCEQMNGLACKAEAVGKRQQVVRPAVIVKFSDRGLFRAKLPKEYIYICVCVSVGEGLPRSNCVCYTL